MTDSLSGTSRRAVVAPVEVRVVHDRPGHERRAVVVVARVLVAEVVREARLVPVDLALDRLGVRVEQQLGRVAPLAALRLPRAVDPVAVALPGRDRRAGRRASRTRRPPRGGTALRRRRRRTGTARLRRPPRRTARSWSRRRRRWRRGGRGVRARSRCPRSWRAESSRAVSFRRFARATLPPAHERRGDVQDRGGCRGGRITALTEHDDAVGHGEHPRAVSPAEQAQLLLPRLPAGRRDQVTTVTGRQPHRTCAGRASGPQSPHAVQPEPQPAHSQPANSGSA